MRATEFFSDGSYGQPGAVELDWGENVSLEQFLAAHEFEAYPTRDGLGEEPDYEDQVEIYYAKIAEGTSAGWVALVGVSDGNRILYFVVRSDAALVELRMRLMPLHLLGLARRLDKLEGMAAKAFHAWHGHYSYYDCVDCDPVAVEIERMNRKRRKESKE